MTQRVDGISLGETASDCSSKVKPRKLPKKSSNHGNSITNTKNQFFVYVQYSGTKITKIGQGKENRAKLQDKSGLKHIKIARRLTKAQALALECTIVWAAILAELPLSSDASRCAKKARDNPGGL